MLKDFYTTPEVELLKFKSAMAIADESIQPGDIEGDDEPGDDLDGDM